METVPWGFVIIGGPAILLCVIVYGYARRATEQRRSLASACLISNTPPVELSR